MADVVSMRDEALAWVASFVSPGGVCGYQLRGGGKEDAPPWQAVGFFSEVLSSGRVVFEGLYVPHVLKCILRVYRETPLVFLSNAVIEDRTSDAHMAAARVFTDAVSNERLRDVVSAEWEMRRSLVPELEDALGVFLYPIPPPVE